MSSDSQSRELSHESVRYTGKTNHTMNGNSVYLSMSWFPSFQVIKITHILKKNFDMCVGVDEHPVIYTTDIHLRILLFAVRVHTTECWQIRRKVNADQRKIQIQDVRTSLFGFIFPQTRNQSSARLVFSGTGKSLVMY